MRIFDRKISVKEMQIQDRNSFDYGISPSTLMECAGYSAAHTIIQKYKLKKDNHVTIVCGTGNNGGDGFVIARHLLAEQIRIQLILTGHPDHIRTTEARLNWKILQSLSMNIQIFVAKDSSFFKKIPREANTAINKSKVIVDCLLGTGIRGKIREPVRTAIEFVNNFTDKPCNIVSIDVPSGINPDTGDKADVFVYADLLITFHRKKLGFKTIDVPEIIVNPIGIPIEADLFVGRGDLKFNIPKRTEFTHKGQYGKVLIIGGSKDYSGAPALAGMAALEMGMDLVYIFAPKSIADVIRTYSPNLIVRSGKEDYLCEKDLVELKKLVEKADSVVIGPGLGTNPSIKKTFPSILSLLTKENIPVVIDANAIQFSQPHKQEIQALNVTFTPHSKEFMDITGKKLPEPTQLQKRMKLIEKNAKDLGATFLVKGRFDYISNGEETRINKTGIPEMAVGGTGDILSGILASLLALKIPSFDAACCAAYINGRLGEHYQIYQKGTNKNGTPLKSSDLLEFISTVLKEDT